MPSKFPYLRTPNPSPPTSPSNNCQAKTTKKIGTKQPQPKTTTTTTPNSAKSEKKKSLPRREEEQVRPPTASPEFRFGAAESATTAGDGVGKCGSE